ncbi:MYXO-CTERM domain-containing protein OS=Streptomyces fumanus OX=67302 GN=GCM10018772_11300 PE=4 SV=1 [Streptomyces fumanus]
MRRMTIGAVLTAALLAGPAAVAAEAQTLESVRTATVQSVGIAPVQAPDDDHDDDDDGGGWGLWGLAGLLGLLGLIPRKRKTPDRGTTAGRGPGATGYPTDRP